MNMDWKKRIHSFPEPRQINRKRQFCIESLFLRFSVRNVALEKMRSATAGEGKMPRTDLATLSTYKLANSTANAYVGTNVK